MSEKQAELVILASENGRDQWRPVLPKDVPDWVKDPDNIARIMRGETCMKCDEGDKGSLFYTAMTMESFRRFQLAAAKRARRAAKASRIAGNRTRH